MNSFERNLRRTDPIAASLLDDVFGISDQESARLFREANTQKQGKFPRLVMNGHFTIDSQEAAPYLERAAEMAGEFNLPIHLQDPREYTIHIVYP